METNTPQNFQEMNEARDFIRGQIKKLENTPDELDLFDIAINKKREKIERIEKEIKRLENGEIIFWVYGDYKNEIKKYLKGASDD